MKHSVPSLLLFMALWFICCSTNSKDPKGKEGDEVTEDANITNSFVEVVEVTLSGSENEYTFSVSLKSSDTGCEQYADWWEVLDMDGNLIYRRILNHSHVNEQPFTRAGGIVAVSKEKEVYIRGHMNNSGYGSKVFKGSVENGFTLNDLDKAYAKDLERKEPLPQDCTF